jgi:hypothetical protein
MRSNNEIRTYLLLKINSEVNNNKKIVFKSLFRNESMFENYQIHFKEFFNGNSCENRFVSKNLLCHRKENISESNTNYITPSNSNINSNKENNLSNINSSLIFLRNLCDDLIVKENVKKRVNWSKSKSI